MSGRGTVDGEPRSVAGRIRDAASGAWVGRMTGAGSVE